MNTSVNYICRQPLAILEHVFSFFSGADLMGVSEDLEKEGFLLQRPAIISKMLSRRDNDLNQLALVCKLFQKMIRRPFTMDIKINPQLIHFDIYVNKCLGQKETSLDHLSLEPSRPSWVIRAQFNVNLRLVKDRLTHIVKDKFKELMYSDEVSDIEVPKITLPKKLPDHFSCSEESSLYSELIFLSQYYEEMINQLRNTQSFLLESQSMASQYAQRSQMMSVCPPPPPDDLKPLDLKKFFSSMDLNSLYPKERSTDFEKLYQAMIKRKEIKFDFILDELAAKTLTQKINFEEMAKGFIEELPKEESPPKPRGTCTIL